MHRIFWGVRTVATQHPANQPCSPNRTKPLECPPRRRRTDQVTVVAITSTPRQGHCSRSRALQSPFSGQDEVDLTLPLQIATTPSDRAFPPTGFSSHGLFLNSSTLCFLSRSEGVIFRGKKVPRIQDLSDSHDTTPIHLPNSSVKGHAVILVVPEGLAAFRTGWDFWVRPWRAGIARQVLPQTL
jgi:hypothetical protein